MGLRPGHSAPHGGMQLCAARAAVPQLSAPALPPLMRPDAAPAQLTGQRGQRAGLCAAPRRRVHARAPVAWSCTSWADGDWQAAAGSSGAQPCGALVLPRPGLPVPTPPALPGGRTGRPGCCWVVRLGPTARAWAATPRRGAGRGERTRTLHVHAPQIAYSRGMAANAPLEPSSTPRLRGTWVGPLPGRWPPRRSPQRWEHHVQQGRGGGLWCLW